MDSVVAGHWQRTPICPSLNARLAQTGMELPTAANTTESAFWTRSTTRETTAGSSPRAVARSSETLVSRMSSSDPDTSAVETDAAAGVLGPSAPSPSSAAMVMRRSEKLSNPMCLTKRDTVAAEVPLLSAISRTERNGTRLTLRTTKSATLASVPGRRS